MKTRTNEEKERTMLERGTFLQILFNPTKNQFKTTNDYEHYLVKNVNKLYSTQSYCPDSNDVSENNLQSPERAFNSHVDFIYAPQLKMSQPGELEFPKEQTFSIPKKESISSTTRSPILLIKEQ
jgi:hypothetical protein